MRSRERNRVLILVENEGVPADRRVWDECQALVEAGYRVSVICPRKDGEPAFELRDQVRLHRYPKPPESSSTVGFLYEFLYAWVRSAGLIGKVLRLEGLDVFQACNPPDTYFALAAPLKLFGKRFVFDQHHLSPEMYISRFQRNHGFLLQALRMLERATYVVADRVISTNEHYRQIAMTRGRKPPESVVVVRNGPDLRRTRRGRPRPELKAGRQYLCCFLGVMEPHDGVELAVRAAHHIVSGLGRRD